MPAIVCTPKYLPRSSWIAAAATATSVNPANRPAIDQLMAVMPGYTPSADHLAAITTKYWHGGGVRLSVSFLDAPAPELRARILEHMNAWAQSANVAFAETAGTGQVRITRSGSGYWSYLGTDVLSIPSNDPTMCLESFTMDTLDSEFHRVVRHETGHTLGFPHEHLRAELVDKIDPAKAIAYYQQTQGWNEAMVRAQVLTPIDQGSLIGTSPPDPNSIMCYQIPGTITKDGEPIVGGADIDDSDFAFAGKLYPR